MLGDALDAALEGGGDRCVLYWADPPADRGGFPLPREVEVRDQVGADLGERLSRVFAELLVGDQDRVVAIGTDCPDLGADAIQRSFDALAAVDMVLGPATDGGYVLLGLRRHEPALFEGVAWGTDRVLEQTRKRALGAGLSMTLLEERADLDRPEDLVRFVVGRTFVPRASGRRTEAALRALKLMPTPL
jgi:rSAM/selenodomain-associated transferase 1